MRSFRLSPVTVLALLVLFPLLAVRPVSALPEGIYDSIPSPLPPHVVSQGFECCQVREIGDNIMFAGTDRQLIAVTVTMSDWATHSMWPGYPAEGWTHPITLNIYAVDHSAANPAVGALLATVTQTFTIPWRPEGDPTCPWTVEPIIYAWRASDGNCYNGFAFNIVFDFTGLNVVLPDEIIFGVTYNTQTWGYNPIGTGGPYDSLNVGLRDYTKFGPVTVGTDVETDAVFLNGANSYDTNPGDPYNSPGPINVFRRDTGWTPYTPALCFSVPSAVCSGVPGITIRKVTTNNDVTTKFVFGVSGQASDIFEFIGGQSLSSGPVETGEYTIIEKVPPEWVLTDISCQDDPGEPHSDFKFMPGEGVTIGYVAPDEVDCTFTNSPAAPVGGVVMPANTLALVAPWLIAIGLVGCISIVVVVARKPR